MPITAMFSKAFYERLGEQVTNELVELLNLIDGTYRSALRAEVQSDLSGLRAEFLREMNRRFDTHARLILLSWVTLMTAIVALR